MDLILGMNNTFYLDIEGYDYTTIEMTIPEDISNPLSYTILQQQVTKKTKSRSKGKNNKTSASKLFNRNNIKLLTIDKELNTLKFKKKDNTDVKNPKTKYLIKYLSTYNKKKKLKDEDVLLKLKLMNFVQFERGKTI